MSITFDPTHYLASDSPLWDLYNTEISAETVMKLIEKEQKTSRHFKPLFSVQSEPFNSAVFLAKLVLIQNMSFPLLLLENPDWMHLFYSDRQKLLDIWFQAGDTKSRMREEYPIWYNHYIHNRSSKPEDGIYRVTFECEICYKEFILEQDNPVDFFSNLVAKFEKMHAPIHLQQAPKPPIFEF